MSVNVMESNNQLINNPSRFGVGRVMTTLVLLLAPLAVWLANTGNPVEYFRYDLPPGQIWYVMSKLIGLYAVMLLWLQAIYGLLRHEQRYSFFLPVWAVSSHRLLGTIVLASALLHAGAFFVAASIRKKEIVTHLLVPDFSHGFYNVLVSIGVIAMVVMLLVVAAGMLRNVIGKHWIWAHRLSAVLLLLVLLHSILIGSEARTVAWLTFYAFVVVTLLLALVKRVRRI